MSIAKSPLWESLIWAKNSLIVRSNSLHGRQKFPARVRRELARKILTRLPFWLPLTPPLTPESTKFPAFSLLAGNFEVRDGFARDWPPPAGSPVRTSLTRDTGMLRKSAGFVPQSKVSN